MAFVALPGVVQVEARFTLFGQQIENVYHVGGLSSPATLADMTTIAGIFNVAIGGNLMPEMSADLLFREVFVRDLSEAGGAEFTLATIPAQAGGSGTEAAPSNAAFCVSLRTARGGRRYRGRKYFSGLPRTLITADVVNTTLADQLVAFLTDLIEVINTAGFFLGIVSKVLETITPVISASAFDLNIDSQRRRLVGRGS
jgi:hypothetical protein